MDPISNPYRPGAGVKPLILAGRDTELKKSRILLKRVKDRNPQRSIMFYGLRGVGKTVLLNEIQQLADQEGYIHEHHEISENDDFKVVTTLILKKILMRVSATEGAKGAVFKALRILKAFSISIPDGPEIKIDVDALDGVADSGYFQKDLTELFENLGKAAMEVNKSICLLFDETQYLKEENLEALLAASHRITQLNLPIVIICAGLPQIAALSGHAKSYAERLFEFIPVTNLDEPNAKEAICGPASTLNVSYEEEAYKKIIYITEGYPYFIQEFGRQVWEIAETSPITGYDVEKAEDSFKRSLDQSFFKVRLDRATEVEKRFLKTMVNLGKGPYKMADIAKRMGKNVKSLGPHRATLIHKGIIYPPQHGFVDFSVPQFDAFLRRYYEIKS